MRGEPPAGEYARLLKASDVLREPVVREAVGYLSPSRGSRGLDAACGTGSNTLLLAEAVGPGGRVTGLDISAGLLEAAGRRAREAGAEGQVAFQQGDMLAMPFENGAFDWLWCMDCTLPIADDPGPAMNELRRVVRSGGWVALLFWSSQVLLPGHPELEARLNATSQGIAPFRAGQAPERHPLMALAWLRGAGLKDCRARTFTGTLEGPLDQRRLEAMGCLFDMRWGGAGPVPEGGSGGGGDTRNEGITRGGDGAGAWSESGAPGCRGRGAGPEDWREFERLCRPESPDFIAANPDYCALFTYSLFRGTVP